MGIKLHEKNDRGWVYPTHNMPFVGVKSHLEHLNHPVSLAVFSRLGYSLSQAVKFYHAIPDYDTTPYNMLGMLDAVELTWTFIEQDKHIRIIGDYDADGITATAVMVRTLKALGANVSYAIPLREDGYGLSSDLIEDAHRDKVDLIITVDNGIRSKNEVELAHNLGMSVIVTDHHQYVDEDYPSLANAVINPQQPLCNYPNKDLSGSGVAFKFAQALFGDNDTYQAVIDQIIQIATIGMVGDMMSMTELENRQIVREGITNIRTNPCTPIKVLCDTLDYKIPNEILNAENLSFGVVPPINASGRMGNPLVALELLLCDDAKRAKELAKQLIELNKKRREVQAKHLSQLEGMLDEQTQPDELLSVLVIQAQHGIVGLLSSDMVRQLNRPVIVLSPSDDDSGLLTGSGRSNTYNIFEALQQCQHLLVKFGGHKGACGMTIHRDNVDAFRRTVNDYLRTLTLDVDDDFKRADAILPLSELSNYAYQVLDSLEPLTNNIKAPVFFAENVFVRSATGIADDKHMAIEFLENGTLFKAMWFYSGYINLPERVDILYSPRWDAKGNVTLTIQALRFSHV